MVTTIFWTDFAKASLNIIFKFYEEEASIKIARKLVHGIINHAESLKVQPQIGQIEEMLLDRPQKFRYLVYKSYKIIYCINERKNRIDIAHVFHTSQNPIGIRES